ncbi:MAG: UvrD-helicase domain-containing protein, partial [Bdellovibrionales bacterium]|nr:UvrD-helicase domain-containing protein [Bdellovibrionales bacterium]NQZ18999.1 UvrD-helicase domain-containing protein [Bdellovibrionales bacterium]
MTSDLNSQLVQSLNEQQQEAVVDFENPLLVLAGAGSGKTRMLTNKIAYGILNNHFEPHRFLAVTFTNKAAGEMKHRISSLSPDINLRDSWVSTFHSFGNRILRSYSHHLGYTSDFTIFDSSDQTSVVKTLLKELKYDNSASNARKVARQIQYFKSDLNALQDPDSYPWSPIARHTYDLYEPTLKKHNALDFADLLLKTYDLLKRFPEVREELQELYQYILVDEYQDTNLIQYEVLKMLSKNKNNVCAVGDEDQSIYSWRGANIFNILNFDKDFKNTRVIKLEQNYRSTKNIIGAASAVIENNSQRKGKKLFTENPDGELLDILESPTEYDEALSIASQIRKTIQGTEYNYSDIAIFYRTNAQSRVLEEKLRNFDIPYKIFGGLKFYDRKEIKDINAYMRLTVNPKDDVSFRRVVNTPTRGLGKTTIDKIEDLAQQMGSSLIEASIAILDSKALTARTKGKLQSFLDILTQLRESCLEKPVQDFYEDLLQMSQYLPNLENEGSMEANNRIQNLEEFGNAIARYIELNPDETHITQFLHHMALVSDADKETDEPNSVTLMTLHIAKGLEFPVVFVAGLEEGLFPHSGSTEASDASDMEMEEERRLFYVGMTRAEQVLFLTYAKQRKVWGQNQFQAPSRFIKEIPENFLKHRIS